MEKVIISKVDEVFIHIDCSKAVSQELYDYFSYHVPGYQYMPKFRKGWWDGKLKIYNKQNNTIYAGLRQQIEKICEERGYEVTHESDFSQQEFSLKEAAEFIRSLNLPSNRTPRDYQLNALVKCIREKRRMTLLPTGSGKSLSIYMLACYYPGKKLIIVPSLSLIHQAAQDFVDYNCDPNSINTIYAGQDKENIKDLCISTWQSLVNMPTKWFDQFSVVICDEAHRAKADELKKIMSKLSCEYRFGFSGSLDGSDANEMVITGLFGPIKRGITTKELIDRGNLANLKIKVILFNYSDEDKKKVKNFEYKDEVLFLIDHQKRNNFIKNLALSLSGNSLVLFQYVQKHGELLYNLIKEEIGDRKLFFIHGGVDGEERNDIRAIVEKEKDAIIVASKGTFAEGVNIQNLHNIIFAFPSKSRIKNLQSIGRGLRKSDTKDTCTLFDLSDSLEYEDYRNPTLNQLQARLKLYKEEKFEYKLYKVDLKGK